MNLPHTIILNPSSGRSRAQRSIDDLKRTLEKEGVHYKLLISQSEEDFRDLVKKNASLSRSLVAAGGDSSFTILLNEVMKLKKRIPLGIIPLGSSDDIALEYNIKNLQDAVKAIKKERTRIADIGLIESGKISWYFPGQANIGIGCFVNRDVMESSCKQGWINQSQTLSGIRAMYRAFKKNAVPVFLRLKKDNEIIEKEFVSLLFSKIRFWSGGRLFLPEAKLNDGKMHLMTIGSCCFKDIIKIMLASSNGGHVKNPAVNISGFVEAEVSSETPFEIQVDGDIMPEKFNSIKIKVIPEAIEVYENIAD